MFQCMVRVVFICGFDTQVLKNTQDTRMKAEQITITSHNAIDPRRLYMYCVHLGVMESVNSIICMIIVSAGDVAASSLSLSKSNFNHSTNLEQPRSFLL